MKIFNISFLQNNYAKTPKYNNISPLAFDTVNFSANKAKDIPYSIYQKQREIEALKAALNEAVQISELLDADELSKRTGLDIYVVKLRLSTSGEIRQICNDMKAAYKIKNQKERISQAQAAQNFFEMLQNSGQQLTDSEIAFYLGLKKDELADLINEFPNLYSLYDKSLLKIEKYSLIEKKAQVRSVNDALRYISKKYTYDFIAKKADLSSEIVRARVGEDDELFKRTIEGKFYPPEIYPEDEIEIQETKIMNILIPIVKNQTSFDIKDIARKTGLYPGVVQMRIENNDALSGLRNRILGIDEDED